MEQPLEEKRAARRLPAVALACVVIAAVGYLWWSRAAGPGTIAVYIVGEVHEPGMVVLPRGSRVAHAIEAAGGLTQRADHLAINLAEKLEDEQKVLVPQRGQAPAVGAQSLDHDPLAAEQPPTMVAGEALPPPPPVPDVSEPPGLPSIEVTPTAPPDMEGHWEGGVIVEEEAAPPPSDWQPSGGGGLVSINRATVEELEAVPGIGPELAANIVAYRQGPPPRAFSTLEDLMNVPGIKMKKLEQLKPYIDL